MWNSEPGVRTDVDEVISNESQVAAAADDDGGVDKRKENSIYLAAPRLMDFPGLRYFYHIHYDVAVRGCCASHVFHELFLMLFTYALHGLTLVASSFGYRMLITPHQDDIRMSW